MKKYFSVLCDSGWVDGIIVAKVHETIRGRIEQAYILQYPEEWLIMDIEEFEDKVKRGNILI